MAIFAGRTTVQESTHRVGKKKAPLELYAALASVFGMPLSELIATAEQRSGKSGKILIEDEENLVGFYRTMEPDQQSVGRQFESDTAHQKTRGWMKI